ncbi:MAG TPA: hypothetical protein VHM31_03095 [Polyangia bacterium]|nr:hypothetical protein [Polyangia bacterium]
MQATRRSVLETFRWGPAIALLGASLLAAQPAAAEQDVLDPDLTRTAQPDRHGPVSFLPEAVAARVNDDRATATTWAGYDGAKQAPLISVEVDARIVGRLALVVGAAYSADLPNTATRQLRPVVGARAQLLDQRRFGVDGAAALMYRKDVFTSEGGFVQAALALERRQGRARVVANLMYGQDGEADDLQGEGRLAAMVETTRGLQVGVDGRYRHLWSSDPHRATYDRPTSELLAGPTASYTSGSWAVMAEAGLSTIRTNVTQSGLIALAGVASSF